MNIRQTEEILITRLATIYDKREAMIMADWVMESISGWKKTDRIINKTIPLNPLQESTLQDYTEALLRHKPLQYILHEAWFSGMKFYVDETVLIPRPETEELVEWLVSKVSDRIDRTRVLDVGTGSGCIPIALKKKLPFADIHSCDISEDALVVARKNALELNKQISFHQLDFLNPTAWDLLPEFDFLISNPPYIPARDRDTLEKNVREYEPALALFVEDNDPVLFYRLIADFAVKKLSPGGLVFVESHENWSAAVADAFTMKGLSNIEIKKDLQRRDRMIKATWLP